MSAFTDDRTPNLDLELPHVDNLTKDDVVRLRSTLGKIDTFLSQLDTKLGTTATTLGTEIDKVRTTAAQNFATAISNLQHYGQYFGDRTTPPEGAEVGAMYLDTVTTPNVVKVLTTTGWQPTVTVSIGGSRQQLYTLSENGQVGPFTVDGGFTQGSININGVELFHGHGVTLNNVNGTFTLSSSAYAAGDVVVFRGFLANDVIDIYLKSEADARFARKQSSLTDTTANRGMLVGAFGLGATSFPPRILDANVPLATGFYEVPAIWTGSPTPRGAGLNQGYLTNWVWGNGTYAYQEFRSVNSNFVRKARRKDDGVWSTWFDLYDQTNILGAVAQSSGIPTGAIVEKGSNANGSYTRFADGTQICFHFPYFNGVVNNEIAGTWGYPAVFAAPPWLVGSINANVFAQNGSNLWSAPTVGFHSVAAASTNVSVYTTTATVVVGASYGVYVVAIGRWF